MYTDFVICARGLTSKALLPIRGSTGSHCARYLAGIPLTVLFEVGQAKAILSLPVPIIANSKCHKIFEIDFHIW